VTLSDGHHVTVGLDTLSMLGLTTAGVEVAPAVLARLERDDRVTALVDRGLAALGRGRRTARELALRFRRVEQDEEIVSLALERLAGSGALSDASTARAEADARLRRGEGPARVRQLLRRKGISGSLADAAVDDAVVDGDFDERLACRTAAEKRLRALRGLDPVVARRRLIAFLTRRGYACGTVAAVLRDLRVARVDGTD
jgi:regulatory protein